jgi:hypothetical protein
MTKRVLALLAICLISPVQFAARAQSKEGVNMDKVRVRYMVNELDPSVKFYTTYLDFRVEREARPNFALLERGNLELVVSTPFGPGGAAKPMPDGRKAEPGGWNRIIINVNDLPAEVARYARLSCTSAMTSCLDLAVQKSCSMIHLEIQ